MNKQVNTPPMEEKHNGSGLQYIKDIFFFKDNSVHVLLEHRENMQKVTWAQDQTGDPGHATTVSNKFMTAERQKNGGPSRDCWGSLFPKVSDSYQDVYVEDSKEQLRKPHLTFFLNFDRSFFALHLLSSSAKRKSFWSCRTPWPSLSISDTSHGQF